MFGYSSVFMREVYSHLSMEDSRPAKELGSVYRLLPKGLVLKDIFCLKEERMVAGDNTISYQGKTFQILPNEYRLSFFKAKVEVHEYLDGRINIFYQDKRLKHKPISTKRRSNPSAALSNKRKQSL